MKKRTKLILSIILLGFFVSGCIDFSIKVNLKKDGSGTLENRIIYSNGFIEMMNSLSHSFNDSTSEDIASSLMDEELIKSYASKIGKGVTFVNYKKVTTDYGKGYVGYYKFDDINQLKIDSKPPTDTSQIGFGSEKVSKTFGSFDYKQGNPNVLEVILSREEKTTKVEPESVKRDTTDMQANDGLPEMVLNMMKNLRTSFKINFEENIVKTNATYKDGNTITLYDLDFGEVLKNPEKYKELKNLSPEELGDIQNLLSILTGFKIEPKEKVTIKFE